MVLKEEEVFVTSGKKKASVQKETNALSGKGVTIVRKNPEPKAATPSEPSVSRGRSVSRKRSIRGKRNHGGAAKPGISVCSRIIRLTSNQTKSQRKATIPTQEEKVTTRMLWLL